MSDVPNFGTMVSIQPSAFDVQRRSIEMSFVSESRQGRNTMALGVVAIVWAWHLNLWVIVIVGVCLLAFGYARWNRAHSTRDKANYEVMSNETGIKL